MILRKYILIVCLYSYCMQTSEPSYFPPELFLDTILPLYIANWSPCKCPQSDIVALVLKSCLHAPDHAITTLKAVARNGTVINNNLRNLEKLILSGIAHTHGQQLHALFTHEMATLKQELRHEKYADLKTAVEENNKLLIRCYVNTYNLNPSRVIHWSNSIGTVKTLLKLGADINTVSVNKNVLLTAIANNDPAFLEELFRLGINVNSTAHRDIDALALCCMKHDNQAARALLEQWPLKKISHLYYCIQHNNKELARILLEQGWNPNQRDQYGETPLTRAVKRNKIDFVRLLLTKGADKNMANARNLRPLAIAQARRSLEIIFLLS